MNLFLYVQMCSQQLKLLITQTGMTQKNVHLAKLLVLHETLLVFDAFHFKIAISKIFPHVSATL